MKSHHCMKPWCGVGGEFCIDCANLTAADVAREVAGTNADFIKGPLAVERARAEAAEAEVTRLRGLLAQDGSRYDAQAETVARYEEERERASNLWQLLKRARPWLWGVWGDNLIREIDAALAAPPADADAAAVDSHAIIEP